MNDQTATHGMNQPHASDFAHTMLGVPGLMTHRTVKPGRPVDLFFRQRWASEARPAPGYGPRCTIRVEVRFDDERGNGHNTFAITGEVRDPRVRRDSGIVACGCLHDEIAAAFPELAPLIRWHLTATDGPMHYAANAVYHASDRDCWGRRKGEPSRFDHAIFFGDAPVSHRLSEKLAEFLRSRLTANPDGTFSRDPNAGEFRVVAFTHRSGGRDYSPHYSFAGYADDWSGAPFRDEATAHEWAAALNSCRVRFSRVAVEFSEGKARDLDAARSVAVWPDATDAELCAEPAELKAALLARLPALLADFRADVERAGFLWSAAPARA